MGRLLTFSLMEEKILSGEKQQTVRIPHYRKKTGNFLSQVGKPLHLWWGNPRHKHRRPGKVYKIGIAKCTEELYMNVKDKNRVYLFGVNLVLYTKVKNTELLNEIARLDGFNNWDELTNVLAAFYGSYRGIWVILRWNKIKLTEEAKERIKKMGVVTRYK